MTNQAFMTAGGRATYMVEPVDAALAEYVGCEGSDYRLVGRNVTVYGMFVATGTVPGRPVRVPGWTSRKGIRAAFVPAVLDDTVDWGSPLDGFLALD